MSEADGSARPLKRSFTIRGHRTSISLEAPFWEALRDIARARSVALSAVVADIDTRRGGTNLSSAVRIEILAHYRGKGGEGNSG